MAIQRQYSLKQLHVFHSTGGSLGTVHSGLSTQLAYSSPTLSAIFGTGDLAFPEYGYFFSVDFSNLGSEVSALIFDVVIVLPDVDQSDLGNSLAGISVTGYIEGVRVYGTITNQTLTYGNPFTLYVHFEVSLTDPVDSVTSGIIYLSGIEFNVQAEYDSYSSLGYIESYSFTEPSGTITANNGILRDSDTSKQKWVFGIPIIIDTGTPPLIVDFDFIWRTKTGRVQNTEKFQDAIAHVEGTYNSSLSDGTITSITANGVQSFVGSDELFQIQFTGTVEVPSSPIRLDFYNTDDSKANNDYGIANTLPSWADEFELVTANLTVQGLGEPDEQLEDSAQVTIQDIDGYYIQRIYFNLPELSSNAIDYDDSDDSDDSDDTEAPLGDPVDVVNGSYSLSLAGLEFSTSFTNPSDFNIQSFQHDFTYTSDNYITGIIVEHSLRVDSFVEDGEDIISQIIINVVYDVLQDNPVEPDVPPPPTDADPEAGFINVDWLWSAYCPIKVESDEDFLDFKMLESVNIDVYRTYTITPLQIEGNVRTYDVAALLKYGFVNKFELYSGYDFSSFTNFAEYLIATFDYSLVSLGKIGDSFVGGLRSVPKRGQSSQATQYLPEGWLTLRPNTSGTINLPYYEGYPFSLTGFDIVGDMGGVFDFQIGDNISSVLNNRLYTFGNHRFQLNYQTSDCDLFYVRWINRLGGWEYHSFKDFNQEQDTFEYGDTIYPINGIDSQNFEPFGLLTLSREHQITVSEIVSRDWYEFFESLGASPLIEHYNSEFNAWERVLIDSFDILKDTKESQIETEITFIMTPKIVQF